MTNRISVVGLKGIKEVLPGDSITKIIDEALIENQIELVQDDIIVIAQKIISKAEGRYVNPSQVTPTDKAKLLAKNMIRKTPEEVQIVLDESQEIVRSTEHVLITEHKLGFIMANAGIDTSNIQKGMFLLLPLSPDETARKIRNYFMEKYKIETAVIISDTFGRPWRNGQTNVAIGVAGMEPLYDYTNTYDTFGNCLKVTSIAQADEIASTAELVMGKTEKIPVAIVSGVQYRKGEGSVKDLIRQKAYDLFR